MQSLFVLLKLSLKEYISDFLLFVSKENLNKSTKIMLDNASIFIILTIDNANLITKLIGLFKPEKGKILIGGYMIITKIKLYDHDNLILNSIGL